jgi:hypothetical protein
LREKDGSESWLPHDELVVGNGAVPVLPPIDGLDEFGVEDGVRLLHSMGDTFALTASLDRIQPKTALIVGAGYVGLEMAEGLTARTHGETAHLHVDGVGRDNQALSWEVDLVLVVGVQPDTDLLVVLARRPERGERSSSMRRWQPAFRTWGRRGTASSPTTASSCDLPAARDHRAQTGTRRRHTARRPTHRTPRHRNRQTCRHLRRSTPSRHDLGAGRQDALLRETARRTRRGGTARSSMCCCPYAARPAPLEPFTRALGAGTVPIEITTDRALVFPAVLDELAPRARHGLCGKPTTS